MNRGAPMTFGAGCVFLKLLICCCFYVFPFIFSMTKKRTTKKSPPENYAPVSNLGLDNFNGPSHKTIISFFQRRYEIIPDAFGSPHAICYGGL